jgi:hypothetical protein
VIGIALPSCSPIDRGQAWNEDSPIFSRDHYASTDRTLAYQTREVTPPLLLCRIPRSIRFAPLKVETAAIIFHGLHDRH